MPLESGFRHRVLLACGLLVMPVMVQAETTGLSFLIEKAINQHPTVAAAEANIASAQGEVDTANWQYYPTVSMSLEGAYHEQNDSQYNGDDLVAQLNLKQPLWSWGALDAGVDIAETRLAMANTKLREQQWQLAENVIEGYGKWLSAYLGMRAWQQGLEDHEALLQQVEKRVRQGVSARIDLALAQGRVASTEAEFIASKDAVYMALQELSQLTSSELLNGDLVNTISEPMIGLPQDSVIAALTHSPKVKLAEAEVRLAQHQLQEQAAQIKPEVYLRAEHRINDFTTADTTPRSRVFVGVSGSTGAGLSWQSQQQTAEATLRARQASLMASQQAVEQRIDSLATNVDSLQRRLASLTNAMVTTSAVAESYSRQFLAGRKSWQEVMNSAREEVQMQVQIVDLEAAYLVASWRMGLFVEGLAGVINAEAATLTLDAATTQGE